MRAEADPGYAEDVLADRQIADRRARGDDLPGKLAAQDPLPRPADTKDEAADELDDKATTPVGFSSVTVESVHGRGADLHQDFVVPGHGPLDLLESLHLGRPVPVVDNGSHSVELERRVMVGDKEKGIAGDSIAPAEHTDDEAEEGLRIAARKEDGEPGNDHGNGYGNPKEEENDIVWDGKEPLHQGQPAIQLASIRIGEVEVDGLLLIGRRIVVIEQGEVGGDAIGEPQKVDVPVEPPPRGLLTEEDHQQQRHEEETGSAGKGEGRVMVALYRVIGQGSEQKHNRDCHDDAECGREPIEWSGGEIDVELHRVAAYHVCTSLNSESDDGAGVDVKLMTSWPRRASRKG